MRIIGITILVGVFALAVWTPVGEERPTMPEPPARPAVVEGVPFADCADLERATGDYITVHGLSAFMDEWYHLVGAAPEAMLNADNATLARSLGIRVPDDTLPVKLSRADILPILQPSRVMADRRHLARFFAEPDRLPELGEARRLFLEWHFLAPRDYAFILEKPGRRKVVGWNTWAEIDGQDDFTMYTFGQIGCTAAIGVSLDGSTHLSHYGQVVDKAQAYVLDQFVQRHPDVDVYLCGVYAESLAEFLRHRISRTPIHIHVKRIYHGLGYTLRVARTGGELSITAARRPVADDYIPSLTHVTYGFFPVLGRFGQIFPPNDEAFEPLIFGTYKEPVNSIPGDTTSSQAPSSGLYHKTNGVGFSRSITSHSAAIAGIS